MAERPRGRPKKKPEDLFKNRRRVSEFKRGPLSDKDKENILKFIDLKSDEEISILLNRRPEQISEYRHELVSDPNFIKLIKKSEVEALKDELHAQMDWALFQKEFTTAELAHFENDYINYRQQFKDVTRTEVKQIYQLIILDIKMHRHNSDLMKDGQDIDRMERLLKELYGRHDNLKFDEQNKNTTLISELETQLQSCRTSKGARGKEYNDFLAKQSDLLKNLKSTREQRIKNLDDEGKFIGLLKRMEQEERKHAMSELVGLMDLASEKEYDRLTDYHKYMDGVIDRPILTAESIEKVEKENNNGEKV